MTKIAMWRPLLQGASAEQAWEAILAVAAGLRSMAPDGGSMEDSDPLAVGLADGPAGPALFFTYLDAARAREGHAAVGRAYLDRAIDQIATEPMWADLFGGFTGVGWTAKHLASRFDDGNTGEEEADPAIDEAVIKLLRQRPWRWDYDLVSGLAGFGVYALEGMPRPTARQCLELLAFQLEDLAEKRPEGVSWFTPPQRLPDHQLETAPRGYYNLGAAHGVSAVIAVLGAICASGTDREGTWPLLDQAVAWLLAQEREAEDGSLFPTWTGEDVEPCFSRLAWC